MGSVDMQHSSKLVAASSLALLAGFAVAAAHAQDNSGVVVIHSSTGTSMIPAYGRPDLPPTVVAPPALQPATPDAPPPLPHTELKPPVSVQPSGDDLSNMPKSASAVEAAGQAAVVRSDPVPEGATASDHPPLVAYVVKSNPPDIQTMTVSKAIFNGWLTGPILDKLAGGDLAVRHQIPNPDLSIGKAIGAAYAQAHAGTLGAMSDVESSAWSIGGRNKKLAATAGGARYVVDTDEPLIYLSYFGVDYTKFDVTFSTHVRIIDTSKDQVIANAGCFIWREHKNALPYDAWLANDAAALKQRLSQRAEQCVEKIEAKLSLPKVESDLDHTFAGPAARPGECDDRKRAYARSIGVDCSALTELSSRQR